jgi:hypothetical protein
MQGTIKIGAAPGRKQTGTLKITWVLFLMIVFPRAFTIIFERGRHHVRQTAIFFLYLVMPLFLLTRKALLLLLS